MNNLQTNVTLSALSVIHRTLLHVHLTVQICTQRIRARDIYYFLTALMTHFLSHNYDRKLAEIDQSYIRKHEFNIS